MTLYLDTSLLVTALAGEREAGHVQNWLDEQDYEDLAISHWVIAEFSSALSIKLRVGDISLDYRGAALESFGRLCRDTFRIFPVSEQQFRGAARFADQHTVGLRSGDALHLAICADHGATVCTLDRRLAEAGRALGVLAVLL